MPTRRSRSPADNRWVLPGQNGMRGATAQDFDSVCPEKQVTTRPGYRPVVTTTPDSYNPLNISNPPGGNARRVFQFHDAQPADRIPPDRCAAAVRAQSAHAFSGADCQDRGQHRGVRSEEHTSELQSLMRKSYAVFCLKKK